MIGSDYSAQGIVDGRGKGGEGGNGRVTSLSAHGTTTHHSEHPANPGLRTLPLTSDSYINHSSSVCLSVCLLLCLSPLCLLRLCLRLCVSSLSLLHLSVRLPGVQPSPSVVCLPLSHCLSSSMAVCPVSVSLLCLQLCPSMFPCG